MARKTRDRLSRAKSFFARIAAAGGGPLRDKLEAAFAAVPRERFLGPPPWYAVASSGYVRVPASSPELLYQDLLFALDRAQGINNGEPTLHGQLIGALGPGPGDTVLHIGCGTGYYSAILAELVGRDGRIVAYEIDQELAARAVRCLEPWPNVAVTAASGVEASFPVRANAVYVNAGATRPMAGWLDALDERGRLVFPLTTEDGWGVTLKVVRRGAAFEAQVLNHIRFIGCVGATKPEEGRSVADAIRSGALARGRSLHRGAAPDDGAVLRGEGWWLSPEPLIQDGPIE